MIITSHTVRHIIFSAVCASSRDIPKVRWFLIFCTTIFALEFANKPRGHGSIRFQSVHFACGKLNWNAIKNLSKYRLLVGMRFRLNVNANWDNAYATITNHNVSVYHNLLVQRLLFIWMTFVCIYFMKTTASHEQIPYKITHFLFGDWKEWF